MFISPDTGENIMSVRTYEALNELSANWYNVTSTQANQPVDYSLWRSSSRPLQGRVLLMPGRNEGALKYTEVAHEWSSRGFRVSCLRPNHDVHNFSSYENEFAFAYRLMLDLKQVDGLPAFVMGHSTGAHVAAKYLAMSAKKGETMPNGLILSAPLAALKPVPGLPAAAMSAIIATMGKMVPQKFASKPEGWVFERNVLTSDAGRYTLMRDIANHHPELAPKGAKWGWVAAAQQSCSGLKKDLHHLTLPHLLLATPNDQVVSAKAQDLFTGADRFDLPESRHEVMMEQDRIRALAWKSIDGFVEKVMAAREKTGPHPGPYNLLTRSLLAKPAA